MYTLNWGELSVSDFLQHYWQQKPVLIKAGFKQFVDPLTADEVAGLALEDEIDSRIVSNLNDDWQLHSGPFTEFDSFGEKNWTLLVQAVDHWHAEAAELLNPFRFIPNWRIDDLMVSFSTPGGGVGPHLDQYDVFIIQGQGKRHWRVGMPDASLQQHCPHPRLLQVTPFTDCIDVITEPGDILYIPPNCPHEGTSVENSLNYSVGFRAPSQKDLINGFADHLLDQNLSGQRFSDKNRQAAESIGAITSADLQQVKQLVSAMANDDALLPHWFGEMISQAKHELDINQPDPHYTSEEIAEYIEEGSVLTRVGGLRSCYYQADNNNEILLFINGDKVVVPATELATVKLLTDQDKLSAADNLIFCQSESRLQLLTQLINQGYWYFTE
ncbi:ribosomal protein uL16 3-hydroxylase [Rheinheimera salexigens]|uniref:50S ribosomal protein L16 arginine hydroxylase n=1 Tax=Rheinheimera salexigens TaxID=1628148 RepID=A0A1E7Q5T7_9GAMM|nr:cupin domain-containing protein [Rheinheimera salexigens]OEY69470.1 50S ribosomal protein L16 arginine hydroxylase [Rheinheimera salexigens]